jgi:hypothetical protein
MQRFQSFFFNNFFTMAENNSPQWRMHAEYVQSCNCDYGCPCNFNALPSYGSCEALIAYRILDGNFGNVNLDGIVFAWGLWWPKAIHMGEGIGKLYLDRSASEKQVKAIEEITSGKHGGGVFTIFPSTFKKILPTEITDISFHWDAYDAHVEVKNAGEVKSQHIVNAKTGQEWEGEILLPGGIIFKRGTVTSVDWNWKSQNISLKHEKKNGHMCIATYTNEGCIA